MSAKRKYEYREGTKARKHFEAGMKALFQVPKGEVREKKKARKKRAKSKSSEPDVSPDSVEASGVS